MDYPEQMLKAPGEQRDRIKSLVQEDYAKAEVYFQTLNVQTIAQEKKYTVRKRIKKKRVGTK
jgi:hypothetical protein